MTDKFQNKYRISSARLKNWDYGNNADYFVTICTANREHYFGEIENGKMILSEIGKIAHKFWNEIPQHFPFIELDAFIIMPNHVHGIIIIDKSNDNCNNGNDNERIAQTPNESIVQTPNLGVSSAALQKWKSGNLGVIINQYKRICTINARKIHADFAWQTRFHDHIIRNDESYQRIQQYIINNPVKWDNDKFFNTNDSTNTNFNKI